MSLHSMLSKAGDAMKNSIAAGPTEIIQLKGTLTILSDTHFVLGTPGINREPLKNEWLEKQKDAIAKWLQFGGLLVLPFPVEIVDMRKKENE
jgi:hypothetical protein